MTTTQVQYYSTSKEKFLDIATMPLPHIANAVKKLEAVLAYGEGQKPTQPHGDQQVLDALKAEMAKREAEQAPSVGEAPDTERME